MSIFSLVRKTATNYEYLLYSELCEVLEEELYEGLSIYWSLAASILKNSGITLIDPPEEFFSIKKNFFSLLFLYSYLRANVPRARRVIYVAINQCLRGMVTGCDNLLDDEYKKTLETNLPSQAVRFRSVLDIMVSDRILFDVLLKKRQELRLSWEKLSLAHRISLRALTRSGAQEASEEGGINIVLEPDKILKSIHHYKTGLLFQCPWAIPSFIESCEKDMVYLMTNALYHIGIGCQVMDDMVDLYQDITKKRHNYIHSLIIYNSKEKKLLEDIMSSKLTFDKRELLLYFPESRKIAVNVAYRYLKTGFSQLFSKNHQQLVEPAILLIAKLIGANRFMDRSDK